MFLREVRYSGSRHPHYLSEVPMATRSLDKYEMLRVCRVLKQAFRIKEKPLPFEEDMIELFLNSIFGKRWRASIYSGETSSSRQRSRPMFFICLAASSPKRIIYVKMELMSQKGVPCRRQIPDDPHMHHRMLRRPRCLGVDEFLIGPGQDSVPLDF